MDKFSTVSPSYSKDGIDASISITGRGQEEISCSPFFVPINEPATEPNEVSESSYLNYAAKLIETAVELILLSEVTTTLQWIEFVELCLYKRF